MIVFCLKSHLAIKGTSIAVAHSHYLVNNFPASVPGRVGILNLSLELELGGMLVQNLKNISGVNHKFFQIAFL